jgi:AcrR family transcriptional regulator
MDRIEIKAGRPSKEQAEGLADHVVAVADGLFIESGYGATSMATVASQARVGKQTLYRRFPDKAALFREVIRRRIDSVIATPSNCLPSRDPLGDLKKMGRAALDLVLDPEFIRLYRTIIAETPLFPELACAASDQWGSSIKDRCIGAIKQAQSIGVCRPGDPRTLAQCFLWSLIGEAFMQRLVGQDGLRGNLDTHLELVWNVFLDGISKDVKEG